MEEVFQECSNFPPILAFSDTQLKDGSSIPEIKGYSFEKVNSSTKAGGVGVYVSNFLHCDVRHDLSLKISGCEDIWLEVSSTDKCSRKNNDKHAIIIGVIYRHDFKSNYNLFCDSYCKILDKLNKSKQKYYICGDFNINLLKYDLVKNVTNYLNEVTSMSCNTLIDKPTRITKNSASCVSHVYSNFDSNKIDNFIIMGDVSDHYGTFSKIQGVSINQSYPDVYFRKTNLNEAQWANFNYELDESLKSLSFPTSPQSLNVNKMAKQITDAYNNLIKKYMPLKKLSNKHNKKPDKPWITSGIKKSIRTKMKLFRKANKTKNVDDYQKYKKFLNTLTHTKKKAEYMYYKNKCILYGQDKSKTWQLINEITNRKRKSGSIIKSLKDQKGCILNEPKDIVNCLNNHFSSVGKEMAEKIKTPKDPLTYINKEVYNSFFFKLYKCLRNLEAHH